MEKRKFTAGKLKQEKVSLEQAMQENKEAREGLKGVDAEKERLQSSLRKPGKRGAA